VSRSSEAGIATVALPMLIWVATLVAIVSIDVAAYFVAAARAQSLADAAALAAVSTDIPGSGARTGTAQAERVVSVGGGRLEHCDCRRGREHARVTVSMPVPGLVIPSLGAGRVAADAQAMLAPPVELAPGPTRERARWTRPQTWSPP
jgi:uncharacterized membrane protein